MNVKEELRNAQSEYLTLLDLVGREVKSIAESHTKERFGDASLSASKVAIIYHKLDVVSEKVNRLTELYKKELFEDND